jgi:nuclease HARBI1
MARPGGRTSNQRAVYSGHKRFHCFSYQSITTPDGLLFNIYGPDDGRRHYMTLSNKIGIDEELSGALLVDGKQFCIYEDAAYVLRPFLQVGFPTVNADPETAVYNSEMNSVRIAVELTYKDIKQNWTSKDYKRKLKVREAPIAINYLCGVLLWNFRVFLGYGGEVLTYINCPASSLTSYLPYS